ncbi:glycine zipper 2TM domain-containing protein [Kordiimonas pumila]|uniref:17 kDa surface antigen n=1 Tax=Kordiimonas pumila TaxID=2161677 RepID=A0ABV7D1Y4_9PROT|nr:glycine zipper 2TM domain-containing protein [Kordiimonas pumila]
MTKYKYTRIALALPLAFVIGACDANKSPNSYNAQSVGEVRRVERGTIESYRWVNIQGGDEIGTLAGAGVGAAAGSTVGHGAEGVIGAIGGAIIGGLIGKSIDKSASKKSGFEYIIRTESGSLVTMVQADQQPLPEGAPVLILFSGAQSRLVFDHNALRQNQPPQ